MKVRIYYTISKLGIIILLPIILLFLPANFFDKGESICLSKVLFGLECYACGMTRACMHLIHFDLEEAFAYNMTSFIVLPLLSIVWVKWFIKEWKVYHSLQTSN